MKKEGVGHENTKLTRDSEEKERIEASTRGKKNDWYCTVICCTARYGTVWCGTVKYTETTAQGEVAWKVMINTGMGLTG